MVSRNLRLKTLGQTFRPLGVEVSAVGGSLVEVRYGPGAHALPNEYLLLGPALSIGGNGAVSIGGRGWRPPFTAGLERRAEQREHDEKNSTPRRAYLQPF
jgi:hypothetical protein